MKVLLGVTGSVAATLTKKLVDALQEAGHEVQVIMTRASEYFVPRKCLYVPVYDENSEWPKERYEKGDEVLHIKLRDWADILVIAPLTANTLAKMSNGICDNLLTCVIRAWDRDKPIVVAPAMNTKMWTHRVTAEQLARLNNWYDLTVVKPVERTLACGDTGVGALAAIADIIHVVRLLNPAEICERHGCQWQYDEVWKCFRCGRPMHDET